MIDYISTRGSQTVQNFEQVLLNGLAPDGGLYVSKTWPKIDMSAVRGGSYADVAELVMYPFVEGCIDRQDFRSIVQATYNDTVFHCTDVTPLKTLYPDLHVLELFHGPTIAFKDIALQLLGRLFDHVLKKREQRVTIVGATSGDTGSAAIEGCRHSEHADIFILYPHGRVSDVQRRQMTTVQSANVHNIAIEGTFDDCQALVKAMFNDSQFRSDRNLSAVNSINWARIMAQIVYYVMAVSKLDCDDTTFVVPTGNFGNVFAAYCAYQMGVPIKTLAVATNTNDILTRFFETGIMEIRSVSPTISPSMDIQISSNFERYLFDRLGRDSDHLRQLMTQFSDAGTFSAPYEDPLFCAFRADDKDTQATINKVYKDTGYVLDPHTAVGMSAALQLKEQSDTGPVVSLACAHPAKFPDAVEEAIGQRPLLPEHLSDLWDKEERFEVLSADLRSVQDFICEKIDS